MVISVEEECSIEATRQTAAAVPGARFHEVTGAGQHYSLPLNHLEAIIAGIEAND